MFNTLGKTLVILNAALSVVFLIAALAIFTNRVDWGWKEPRQYLNSRVPSEIDKRTAAVKSLLHSRDLVEKAQDDAVTSLAAEEKLWGDYHLYYAENLAKLHSAPGEITVKKIELDPKEKGKLAFDPSQPGRPILKEDVFYVDSQGKKHAVKESFETLDKKQKELQKKIAELGEKIITETGKLQKATELIGGFYDPKGENKLKPGIHDLLEDEKQLQKQLKREIEEIEPLWVRKLVDSQVLVSRRDALVERLNELKEKKGEKKP